MFSIQIKIVKRPLENPFIQTYCNFRNSHWMQFYNWFRSALIHDTVLLIALGDGRVLYYEIQNDELGNIIFPTGPPKKIFSIGITPSLLLSHFKCIEWSIFFWNFNDTLVQERLLPDWVWSNSIRNHIFLFVPTNRPFLFLMTLTKISSTILMLSFRCLNEEFFVMTY